DGQQLFAAGVTQHAHERRVGIEELSLRSGEINSFLQGLEEWGEALLRDSLRGAVPRQCADLLHAARAGPLKNTIEVAHFAGPPETHADHPGPGALFQETGQTLGGFVARRLRHVFFQRLTDELSRGHAENLREAAI